MSKNVVMVGAGVANVNAATKLIDNGFKGKITIIDMGKDPYLRPYEEVMTGFLGAGGWSDGKLTYHTSIGGQLSKYCGEEKAMELFDQVIDNFKRFHPKPEEVQCSNPIAEPDFIKPYFGLRLFPVWHVGTDYLHEIGKNWYDYLVEKGVEFKWETKVTDIHFDKKIVMYDGGWKGYDKLIFGVGKSGIDFGQLFIDIKVENLISTILFLKTNEKCKFKQLIDITAVDYPQREKRFKIVYLLLSHENNLRIVINTIIDEKVLENRIVKPKKSFITRRLEKSASRRIERKKIKQQRKNTNANTNFAKSKTINGESDNHWDMPISSNLTKSVVPCKECGTLNNSTNPYCTSCGTYLS